MGKGTQIFKQCLCLNIAQKFVMIPNFFGKEILGNIVISLGNDGHVHGRNITNSQVI